MKYFTKEWYETRQNADLHHLLMVSKRAESFSEDYYQTLYKKQEKVWLKQHEDLLNVIFEDITPDEFAAKYGKSGEQSHAEFEANKNKYYHVRGIMLQDCIEGERVFCLEQAKSFFRQIIESNTEYLKAELPKRILKKVADIRVLALNRAAESIKQEIAYYNEEKVRPTQLAEEAYRKEHQESFKNETTPYYYDISCFHDSMVISCQRKDADFFITICGMYADDGQLIFRNCTVQKQDQPLEGTYWKDQEIYKTKEGYNVHVLFYNPDTRQRIDFIVNATDIAFEKHKK